MTFAFDYEKLCRSATPDSLIFAVGLLVGLVLLCIVVNIQLIRFAQLSRKYYGIPYKKSGFIEKMGEDLQLLFANNSFIQFHNAYLEQISKDSIFSFSLLLVFSILMFSFTFVYRFFWVRMALFLYFGGYMSLSFLVRLVKKRVYGHAQFDKQGRAVHDEDKNSITFEAENIFQDFETPTLPVMLLCSVQLILTAMYCWGAFEAFLTDLECGCLSNEKMYYYTLATFISVSYFSVNNFGSFSVGSECWVFAIEAARKGRGKAVYVTTDGQYHELAEIHIWIRSVADIAVNCCAVLLIVFVVPVQASTSGSNIDFVLNVLSAFFIIGMDDLTEKQRYKFVMERTKVQTKITDFFNICTSTNEANEKEPPRMAVTYPENDSQQQTSMHPTITSPSPSLSSGQAIPQRMVGSRSENDPKLSDEKSPDQDEYCRPPLALLRKDDISQKAEERNITHESKINSYCPLPRFADIEIASKQSVSQQTDAFGSSKVRFNSTKRKEYNENGITNNLTTNWGRDQSTNAGVECCHKNTATSKATRQDDVPEVFRYSLGNDVITPNYLVNIPIREEI